MSIPFLAVVAAFGVVTGVLSGSLGVGGGVFMVPFLVLVGGPDQQHAQATSLLVVAPTSAVATVWLRRLNLGDVSLGLRMGAVGVLGGVSGTLLALALPQGVLSLLFACLMSAAGLRLLRDASRMGTADGL
jgi:uncharacterized membrane protein YfcA